jgi:hypothetical protein
LDLLENRSSIIPPCLRASVVHSCVQGSRHLLAAYLQALLCYPDAASIREEVVVDPRTQEILGAAPRLPAPLPKEEELLQLIAGERAQGRRVLVYATFTGTWDITAHLERLVAGAGLRVAVLRGSVEPTRREAWIRERVEEGTEVLIANPELAKTGLDL